MVKFQASNIPVDPGDPFISVNKLTKAFDQLVAVNAIDFVVHQGELFGFLGPNGAGKTTTINMLIGLARPDSGEIRIAGLDCSRNPKAAQHLIGVVPDESNLYPELSGYGNLCFCASLYGILKHERHIRASELLIKFGLNDAAHRRFGTYSKGMKRKLTIAAGIIHRPPVLFLDEPTTGIDVASARQIRQLIADLHRDGTTIFLTTHYIEEAERLCERIAFIVDGKIVKIDSVPNLLEPVLEKKTMILSVSIPARDLLDKLETSFPELSFQTVSDDQIRIESSETIRIGPLLRFIEKNAAEVMEARRIRPSLEDVFVRLTGIELTVMKKEKEKGGNS